MNKKSQITIIITIGVIIIIILGIILWYVAETQKEDIKTSADDVVKFSYAKDNVDNYVDQCLDLTVEEMQDQFWIINEAMAQDYINENLLDCIDDFKSFRDQGFNFDYEQPQSAVIIEDELYIINLSFPIIMTRADDRVEFDKFGADANVNHEIVYDPVEEEEVVEESNGEVMWIYRHFPLDGLHPEARDKAVASECAASLGGNDAFWAFADELFETGVAFNNMLAFARLPLAGFISMS